MNHKIGRFEKYLVWVWVVMIVAATAVPSGTANASMFNPTLIAFKTLTTRAHDESAIITAYRESHPAKALPALVAREAEMLVENSMTLLYMEFERHEFKFSDKEIDEIKNLRTAIVELRHLLEKEPVDTDLTPDTTESELRTV